MLDLHFNNAFWQQLETAKKTKFYFYGAYRDNRDKKVRFLQLLVWVQILRLFSRPITCECWA